MPEKKRNFWIMLTLFATIFAGAKFIQSWQTKNNRSCHVTYTHKCQKQQKRKSCSTYKHERRKRHCNKSRLHEIATPQIDDFVFVHREPVAVNVSHIKHKISRNISWHSNGHDAAVVVRVLVDEHGNYLRHKVISSTHPELKRRSDAYASQLVFTPAIRDGRAVRYWVNVPFYYGN